MQEAVIIDRTLYHAYEIGTIVEIIGESSMYPGNYLARGWSADTNSLVRQVMKPSEIAFLMPCNPS